MIEDILTDIEGGRIARLYHVNFLFGVLVMFLYLLERA